MIIIVLTTVYFKVLVIIASLSGALLHKNIDWNIRGIDIVRYQGWQMCYVKILFLIMLSHL